MDIINEAKNIATVLATATTTGYVAGYLALRTRAHVLGTDPSFALLDEAYIFAGFRFFFITLLILLLLVPILLPLHSSTMWLLARVPAGFGTMIQWVCLGLLAIVTVLLLGKITQVNGLLLSAPDSGASKAMLGKAIIGENSAMSISFSALTVLLVVISAVWFYRLRLAGSDLPLIWVLGVVLSIQILLLPMYHGALFADRNVRVLGAVPDALTNMDLPLGVIDRTSVHVTLIGLNSQNKPQLVTLKKDDLNGVPISKVVKIAEMLKKELVHGDRQALAQTKIGSSSQPQTSDHSSFPEAYASAMKDDQNVDKKNFFNAVVDYLKITFENIGSLSDSVVESGELWTVTIDEQGVASPAQRIGNLDKLSWPVAQTSRSSVIALQEGKVVRIVDDGNATEILHTDAYWIKLFGVDDQSTVVGMIYENGDTVPVFLLKNGEIQKVTQSLTADELTRKAKLLQENRAYAGQRALIVKESERGGRGYDVFLKSGGRLTNLSDCGDDSCGQASLSPDFRRALFIRHSRY